MHPQGERLYTNDWIKQVSEFMEQYPIATKIGSGAVAILITLAALYHTDHLPTEITEMFNNLLAKVSR
jgi:hypothetical protein